MIAGVAIVAARPDAPAATSESRGCAPTRDGRAGDPRRRRPAGVRHVVLRDVAGWRWRPVTDRLVDVELTYRARDTSRVPLADVPRSWSPPTIDRTRGCGSACAPRRGRERRAIARQRPREDGEAMIFAIFALLLLALSLALLGLTMRLRLEEQQREVRRVHLDLLLDGAVAETLARLAVDPRFTGVAPRRDGGRRGLERGRAGSGAHQARGRGRREARAAARSSGSGAWCGRRSVQPGRARALGSRRAGP